ncbi:Phosphotransferase enzyme family protein [Brevibacterium sandarakinum]|uniref:Phosphotransferase enzyme family protein n=1 Tax=Brevibacterium sandarakinum TaxID=629680 RepID=A0A1H1SKX2_BRESA|nr:phosphotransferase [Brevibacterium sandarakinum]SDS48376.1 Phosphotransferase enzyme family protein [Brevibacterium sandarakinum]
MKRRDLSIPKELNERFDVVSEGEGHGQSSNVRRLLEHALGDEAGIGEISPLGIGASADSYRVSLDGGERWPKSVVVKLPSQDPTASRTAMQLGLYEREVWFYEQLGTRLELDIPRFYRAIESDGLRSGLMIEDLSSTTERPNQLQNAQLSTVRGAMSNLARLQAPYWADGEMSREPWLHKRLGVEIPHILDRMQKSWSTSRKRLSGGFEREQLEVIDVFVERAGDWARSLPGPFSLTHHDYRLDNILLGDGRAIILDWQTVGWGPPMFDVAYLLSTSWDPRLRRQHERELIRDHVEELGANGVRWDFERAWEAYRRSAFATLLMLVPPTGSVKQDARTDTMYKRLLAFGAQQVLDLGALEFLKEV